MKMGKHDVGDYFRATDHPGIVCLKHEALSMPEASVRLPDIVAELAQRGYQRLLALQIDLRSAGTVALLESLGFQRRQEMHCHGADLNAERFAVPGTARGIEVTDIGRGTGANLYRCVRESFSAHPIVESEAQLNEVITDPRVLSDCSFAAWSDNRITGFLIVRCEGSNVADFAYLGVVPDWRRRGIGLSLILRGLRACQEAGFYQATAVALPSNVAVAELLPQAHFIRTSSQFNFSLALRSDGLHDPH